MAYWEHEEKKTDPMELLMQVFAGGGDKGAPASRSEVDETMSAEEVGEELPFDIGDTPEGTLQMLLQLLSSQR